MGRKKLPAPKPQLKADSITYFVVRYRALENFIRAAFRQEYNFVMSEEARNDSVCAFFVTGIVGDFELAEVRRFRRSGSPCRTSVLLDYLCRRGFIPEGHYLVEVSW